jgi:hypothetical protein
MGYCSNPSRGPRRTVFELYLSLFVLTVGLKFFWRKIFNRRVNRKRHPQCLRLAMRSHRVAWVSAAESKRPLSSETLCEFDQVVPYVAIQVPVEICIVVGEDAGAVAVAVGIGEADQARIDRDR